MNSSNAMRASQNPHRDDLRALLVQKHPILDVRAPGEFTKGAVPHSTNIPILNDDERAKVGTTYKRDGAAAAYALGMELVSGPVRESRLQAWQDFIVEHPATHIACWRGGQRSKIATEWLNQVGCEVPRVPGGYKALRGACLEILSQAAQAKACDWWIVGGQTGSRKTTLINSTPTSIDLEGIAHHRGSAFGGHPEPQPTPASFENALAVAYLDTNPQTALVLEDESRTIGRLALPEEWFKRMQRSPIALVEVPLAERVQHIKHEYVDTARESAADLRTRYLDALGRISRRLGGVTYVKLEHLMKSAFDDQGSHEAWIEALLCDYYDPMYAYQIQKKEERIKVRGSYAEIQAFLADLQ